MAPFKQTHRPGGRADLSQWIAVSNPGTGIGAIRGKAGVRSGPGRTDDDARRAGRAGRASGVVRGPAGRRTGSGRAVGPGRQTRPSFSRPVQQVSVMRRVTTYGSTLAFGRRSSM